MIVKKIIYESYKTTFNFLPHCKWARFSVFVARGTIVSWYVLEKTNSTLIVGLITSIPTMTLITLGPLGGRLADSFPREKIFFYARIVIFIVMALLAMFINLNF